MKHLIKLPKQPSKESWLQSRRNFINGSEVAVVMMLSEYKSRLQLYLEKIGQLEIKDNDNKHTFMGRYFEDRIADLWQYYDGSEESIIANYNSGNKVRRCRRLNNSVCNPKYPHLAASFDRVIYKIKDKYIRGILEIKNTTKFAASKWENGIDPSYLIQLQTYLLISEYEIGELCILKDGKDIEVLQVEPNKSIQEHILDSTNEFWELVCRGKVLYEEYLSAFNSGDMIKANEYNAMLQSIEPEPEGTKVYEEFLSERYKCNNNTIMLNSDNYIYLEYAKKYAALNKERDSIEQQKTYYAGLIKNYMKESGVFDLGEHGKITWKNKANGSRTFYVKINNNQKK